MNYWLMKTEPATFGVEALAAAPRKTSCWDGVRNYQVRNMLRDDMRVGDLAFMYYSSCDVPGIAAVMEITRAGYPDHTAFERRHAHHDAGSDANNPRWYMVDVRLQRRLKRVVTLEELREHATSKLSELLILRRGNRLSIVPVSSANWKFILSLE